MHVHVHVQEGADLHGHAAAYALQDLNMGFALPSQHQCRYCKFIICVAMQLLFTVLLSVLSVLLCICVVYLWCCYLNDQYCYIVAMQTCVWAGMLSVLLCSCYADVRLRWYNTDSSLKLSKS